MPVIRFGFAQFPLDVPIPPEYSDSYAVPDDINHFWQALLPAMNEVIEHHPVRQGRNFVPPKQQKPADFMPHDALASFGNYMNARDPTEGVFRYQLYDQRTARDQSYPVWFLQQLFDYITGDGFAI